MQSKEWELWSIAVYWQLPISWHMGEQFKGVAELLKFWFFFKYQAPKTPTFPLFYCNNFTLLPLPCDVSSILYFYSVKFCRTSPLEAFCQASGREGSAAVSSYCPSQPAQAKQIALWMPRSAASQRNGLICHVKLCSPEAKGY